MHQPRMLVLVGVWFNSRITRSVRVLVVQVVDVRVLVDDSLMHVLMLMMLGQVNPEPDSHEDRCRSELPCDGLAQ